MESTFHSADSRPLQLSIPAHVYLAFCNRANEVYAHARGARSSLFIEMWEEYCSSRGIDPGQLEPASSGAAL